MRETNMCPRMYHIDKHREWRITSSSWLGYINACVRYGEDEHWYSAYEEAERERNKILGKAEEKYLRRA